MSTIKKLGIAVVLLWTLGVTVLRAARLPNDFAEAHWLLDYRFGFVKRGLVGTLVSLATSLLQLRPTEQLIAVLASVAFGVYCLVLMAVALRTISRSGGATTAVLTVLVFFSSPFIVMSAHLIGYLDNIIFMLGVMSLALLLNGRIYFAACLQATAVVVHESSLLICFPALCLAWLLLKSQQHESEGPPLPFWPLLLPIGAFLILAVGQSVFLAPGFQQSFARHLAEFPFIQRSADQKVPEYLSTTFVEYYMSQRWQFLIRLSSASMYGLVLPATLAILCFILHAYGVRELSLESCALLGVCLAPQLLHLVAWDLERIWTYSILSSFLALWVYAEVLGAGRPLSPSVRLLSLAALVVNIMGVTPLMDGKMDHFNHQTRLLLYTPVIAASLALILCADRVRIKERLSIQGQDISRLLWPTRRLRATLGSAPRGQPETLERRRSIETREKESRSGCA